MVRNGGMGLEITVGAMPSLARSAVCKHSFATFNFRPADALRANDAHAVVFRNRLDAFEQDEFRSLRVVELEFRAE